MSLLLIAGVQMYTQSDDRCDEGITFYSMKYHAVKPVIIEDGLLSKTTSSGSTTTYEYKFNKNGLVTTIIKKTTDEDGKKSTEKINVTYSKTKTDQKTYALFINGFDTCYSNALL